MTTIAITAGGTSENIDGVRTITNVSTGSLGWHCLEAAIDYFEKKGIDDFRLFYILTKTAIRKELSEKQQSHVHFIEVTDAESVYQAVDTLTKKEKIDYFIHSMAISDFKYSFSVKIGDLAQEICNLARKSENISIEEIESLLQNPENSIDAGTKISSSDAIFMALTTTKKVIPVIKKNNPETVLVGFKLLKSVSEAELMQEAQELTEKNDCDLVFANEVSRISESNHTGLLIRKGEIIERPTGKKQIAQSIIKNLLIAK